MNEISIIKLDYMGLEIIRYSGVIIERGLNHTVLEADFDREDTPVGKITLRRGDRFIETYYADRWYNIFEIHDGSSDHVKGWYCNIGYPAEITETQISYRDLALDLLVYPDGEQLVLDEDEFKDLPISTDVREKALQALKVLQNRFLTGSINLNSID